MSEIDFTSEILLLEEHYQMPMMVLLSLLESLNLPTDNVAIFFLIFNKTPEGIEPMVLWLKEQIVDKGLTDKELTYSVLMQKAILLARSIEGSLPEKSE